jgi:hypothetical protein
MVCAVGLVLAACGGGPTPSVSPSAEPSAPTDLAEGWARIDVPDAGAIFTDVASIPFGLVIVGGGAGALVPRAWESVDGTVWEARQLTGDGFVPTDLLPWGDRLIALGGGQTSRCAHPVALDAWRRSADGAWQEAPWDPIFCAGGTASQAAASDHLIVAGFGTGDVPFVWTSRDGLSWTDNPFPRAVGAPRAVASIGGTDVVMGTSFETGRVWVSRSHDGAIWSPPEPLVVPSSSEILGLMPVDGRFVAILRSEAGAFGAVRSDDGVDWDATEVVGLPRDVGAIMVAVEDGLVALSGTETGPLLWASADGTSWRSVAVPADAETSGSLLGITVRQGRVYVVGQAASDAGAVGAAWVGPASLIAP